MIRRWQRSRQPGFVEHDRRRVGRDLGGERERIGLLRQLPPVVPDNRDPDLCREPDNPRFWERLTELRNQAAVEFAQHGHQHIAGDSQLRHISAICDESYGLQLGRPDHACDRNDKYAR